VNGAINAFFNMPIRIGASTRSGTLLVWQDYRQIDRGHDGSPTRSTVGLAQL
jgi:hypothetical protein